MIKIFNEKNTKEIINNSGSYKELAELLNDEVKKWYQ